MSKLQIIMYHYVRDLQNSRYPNIRGLSDKNFMKQIDYLEANYTLVTPQDVIEAYNGCLLYTSELWQEMKKEEALSIFPPW